MAAGRWNTRIDRGAVWRRAMSYSDALGNPIEIQAPGFMEIRVDPDEDSVLITRLDSTGSAPGLIEFGPAVNQLVLTLPDHVTADIPAGQYYFDVFVTDSTDQLVKLVHGEVQVRNNVSVSP